MKIYVVVKVLLGIWSAFLHENNGNYNSCRFSYKMIYSLFVFSYKPKTRIRFLASCWSGNKKCFYFVFIASPAWLQSHAEFNKWIFLHVIPIRIIVTWLTRKQEKYRLLQINVSVYFILFYLFKKLKATYRS